MKTIITKVATQLATSAAGGFCFTAGAYAWKKLSDKTGIFKPETKETHVQ